MKFNLINKEIEAFNVFNPDAKKLLVITLVFSLAFPFVNTPLRSIKGTVFEGGIRVPGIVRFPPLVKPGSVCDEPIISTDLFPTLLDVTHTPHCADKEVEGVSIVPLLNDPKAALKRDIPLFWHFPHYHAKDKYGDMAGALRVDNWKYIHFYDTGEDLLFDLSNDLAENNNCALEHPDRTEQMRRLFFQVLKQTHANMPKNISTKTQ